MKPHSQIALTAAAKRAALGFRPDELASAERIIERCEARTGILRALCLAGDARLVDAAAQLDPGSRLILLDGSRPGEMRRLDAAHMFGHYWLHGRETTCCAEPAGPLDSAGPDARADDWAHECAEREAAEFAAELLLPLDACRRAFVCGRNAAAHISQTLGLPIAFVFERLGDAVLLYEEEPDEPLCAGPSGRPVPRAAALAGLDSSQTRAAALEVGPLLLGAGPGTGKTRTLVARCAHLMLDRGVPGRKILALTFSRKAAAEIRERLSALTSEPGKSSRSGPVVDTIHGFGARLLRKYAVEAGLPPAPRMLGSAETLEILEAHLGALDLVELDSIYDPAYYLSDILNRISRAKDELCTPEEYAALCRHMAEGALAAETDLLQSAGKILQRDRDSASKAKVNAAKAAEVAQAYAIYEEIKQTHGFLDYGDLISRTVSLLEAQPHVLEAVRRSYEHVLADEYQDVNRGCARLIQLIAGPAGAGLWAVGDSRQSIYRFRGASPANISQFRADFPTGHVFDLDVNYRSVAELVDLCSYAGHAISRGAPGAAASETHIPGTPLWTAARGPGDPGYLPRVQMFVGGDRDEQAEGIAREIRTFAAAGIPMDSQAILCRTHSQASDLAARLANQSIPTDYRGRFLEREEIKDLLAVISFAANRDAAAHRRIASFSEYVTANDECPWAPPDAPLGPLSVLNSFLFDQSRYLESASIGLTRFERRRKFDSIHELLSLAAEFEGRRPLFSEADPESDSQNAFLAYLRRLAASNELNKREATSTAGASDAVHLMTVHSAKGLEFPVVFVPNLEAGQFPPRSRHDAVPDPPGLTQAGADEMAEEECLFFVALSRARDYLVLSRSEAQYGKIVPESPLLGLIKPWLTGRNIVESRWPCKPFHDGRSEVSYDIAPPGASSLPVFSVFALETYLRCPRRYYYHDVLEIKGLPTVSGYPALRRCLTKILEWREQEWATGRKVDEHALLSKLDELWPEFGPAAHRHAGEYRKRGERLLRNADILLRDGEQSSAVKAISADLSNCRVRARPDILAKEGSTGTLIAVRVLYDDIPKGAANLPLVSLYRRAVHQAAAGGPSRAEVRSLASGEVLVVDPPATEYKIGLEAARLKRYDDAAEGILKRQFQPTTRTEECRDCPFRIVCPT